MRPEKETRKHVNKTFIIGILIGVLVVGGGIGLIWVLKPSMQEQKAQLLVGAFREGTPEFEKLTKRIITETDGDKTWESPVGTGTIMMNIAGKIRNYNDVALTGLEVRVTVVDMDDKPVKDNTVVVVPTQQPRLEPRGEIAVNIQIEGFKPDDVRARIRWKVTAIKTQ